MSISNLALFLSLAATASEVVLITRLLALKLYRTVPFLTIYLVFDSVSTTLIWLLGRSTATPLYRSVWVLATSIALILQIALILELYNLFHKTYPGIRPFARIILLVSLIVAIVTAAATITFDLPRISLNPQYQVLRQMFLVHRIASSIFGSVSLITTTVLPRVPERRTVFLYGSVLSMLFLSAATRFFVGNLLPTKHSNQIAGVVDQVIQLSCYVIWIVGFRRQELPVLPRSRTASELTELKEMRRLNDDLATIGRWLITGR